MLELGGVRGTTAVGTVEPQLPVIVTVTMVLPVWAGTPLSIAITVKVRWGGEEDRKGPVV